MTSVVEPSKPAQATNPWAETDKRIQMAMELALTAPLIGSTESGRIYDPVMVRPLTSRSANTPPLEDADVSSDESSKDSRGVKRAQDPEAEEQATAGKKRKTTTAKETATDTKKSAEALLDVSSITLPEEADGRLVPVYETCDSIRRQIRAILKKPGVTQVAFCRALGRCGTAEEGIGCSPLPKQLARFMEKQGIMKGNMDAVFYPSYLLFEKMRLRDGKGKSKFRREMEEKHAKKGGVDVLRSCDVPFAVKGKNRVGIDRWGALFMIHRN